MDSFDWYNRLTNKVGAAGLTVGPVGPPSERSVISNNIRLHLLDWGFPTSPAIVLLHGGSLTAHTWDLICMVLSDRYRCIAIDFRGHGDSEWPADADYRLETIERDVACVIADLDLVDPVVVGMSLGGLVGLRLAASTASELSGLVVVDVGPEFQPEGAEEILSFIKSQQDMDSVEEFVESVMRFKPGKSRESLKETLQHNLRQLPSGRWSWKWDSRRLSGDYLESMKQSHSALWDCAAKIHCPTLIIRGKQSRIFLSADANRLADAIPGSSSVATVDNAGHTVHGDNPREFLAVVEPFVHRCFGSA